MSTSWQNLEQNVRTLASFKWNADAIAENINGVDFDCVLKPETNYWVIIETTKEFNLDKIRTDLAKCATARMFLFTKNIFAKFYVILERDPTTSMITSAEGNHVEVMSFNSFSKTFLDYPSYSFTRIQKNFGSSVDPFSGMPDKLDYTPVLYENTKIKKEIKLNEISRFLLEGRRIILLGNYGTGKSRCVRELFTYLSSKVSDKVLYPIAINLKENWGTERAEEIIRRHFGSLGLSHLADSALKILDSDRFVFFLDGFDEIGAQIWSNDTSKLELIRASSLKAVKELIQITKSPVIITGREHYFNSNKEMFNAIGFDPTETEILRCKDEFTEEEMSAYLKSLSLVIDLPMWLPRRPLICQIINSIDRKEIEKIFIDTHSSVEFWNTLIKNICDRESRISAVLNSETIFSILKVISNLTRYKQTNNGPLSISEINNAFELVVGTPPVDESAVMLQRLPALGRISSETTDRQFVDNYILDGLRAESLIDVVYQDKISVLSENWINPLNKTGLEIVARRIKADKSANVFLEFLKKSLESNNKIIRGDILGSLTLYASSGPLDLGGIIIKNTDLTALDFSSSLIENFLLIDSYIDELDISNSSFSRVSIKECLINKMYGVQKAEETPSFIVDCQTDEIFSNSMNSNRRLCDINPQHMILISLIKKIFLLDTEKKNKQELLNGFGKKADRNCAEKILGILVRDKIVNLDNAGYYTPKTFNRTRMTDMLSKLNKSNEPLWKEVGKLECN